LLELREVWFRYPEAEVFSVQGVSLTISECEFTAILGPNGSGKSTLARLLTGLVQPTDGQVLVDGLDTRDREALWDVHRTVQMVFQNPENQIVGTSLADDVAFGLSNIGVPQAEMAERISRALSLVGLDDRAEASPHALSGGEKQRLAAAAALALEPRYLILDEATAMLDPAARRELMATILRVRRERNFGLIHITHHLEEVLEADRVVLMDGGRLQQAATPAELLSQPALLGGCGIDLPYLPALAARLREGGLTFLGPNPTLSEVVARLCS